MRKRIFVRIEWNTDHTGLWVERNVPSSDYPHSIYGPFDDEDHVLSWMIAYPDDTDVYDMFSFCTDIVDAYVNSPSFITDQLEKVELSA